MLSSNTSRPLLSYALLLSFILSSHAVSLYPAFNATFLAASFGVSSDCLAALNTSLNCDSTTFNRLKNPDYYLWSSDNVTRLCTSDCTAAIESWNETVTTACADDTIEYMGKAVPAETIAGRYVQGASLVCLTNSTGDSCIIASQNWVGSDLIYNSDGSIADEQPLTAMYEDSMLCSECFVSMLQTRLNSPYIPDAAHSDYMVSEFAMIVSHCSLDNAAYTLTQSALYPTYATANATATATVSSTITGAASTAATCTGQSINPSSFRSRRQLVDPDTAFGNVSSTCNQVATAYNIATGEVISATGNNDCNITSPICVSDECDIQQLASDETCASIATALSTASETITTVQLLAWNPYLIGVCDNLMPGQYICTSPPGGAWTLQIANITNSTGDGDGVTYTVSSLITATATVAETATSTGDVVITPTPYQTGMAGDCDVFHLVASGDTCYDLAQTYDITLDEFYAWNPAVGDDCSALDVDDYVCVGILSSATATQTTTSTATTVVTPTPTQTGMVSDCDDFYFVEQGDDCYDIAADNGITLDEFYAWNPAVGDDCSGLDYGYYVCIGIV